MLKQPCLASLHAYRFAHSQDAYLVVEGSRRILAEKEVKYCNEFEIEKITNRLSNCQHQPFDLVLKNNYSEKGPQETLLLLKLQGLQPIYMPHIKTSTYTYVWYVHLATYANFLK